MKLLYLTFYFEPDLCAGSFRNTPLVKAIQKKLNSDEKVFVITTMPNRYKSFKEDAKEYEQIDNLTIYRIPLPKHQSGFIDQILSFNTYFFQAIRIAKKLNYDAVFASSSRLFTAVLGRYLSQKRQTKLYLDIRDIFTDTISDVIKNRIFQFFLLPIINGIERYSFNHADRINLVSRGFEGYFQKYKKPSYSFYTNGIDEVFIASMSTNETKQNSKQKRQIVYAGNIGEGQGLHKVVPKAAKLLGDDFEFLIIGDGGAKQALEKSLKDEGVSNVVLIRPVGRQGLIEYYKQADYLFLHLNNYKAFEKVLPSKIFEFAAFNKPIIAGVSGYCAQFIRENLNNHLLFDPGDFKDFVKKLKTNQFTTGSNEDFIKKFKRTDIMDVMSNDIINELKNAK